MMTKIWSDDEVFSDESVQKAQDFINAMKDDANKGEMWAIIVHEVSMFRAILSEARQKPGADQQLMDRIVSLAALHTAALVKHAGFEDREHEIMADTDALLGIAVSSIDQDIRAKAAAASNSGETLH
jgi:ATP phosphoribosyltransferase regulatory subunit HisZ